MPRVRIDFSVYFLLALYLLLLPPEWMMAVLLAVCVHELCHYAAARFLGVRVSAIRVGLGGTEMELAPMTRREEGMIAAAGPVGSLLLLCFASVYPELSLCGLVHGIYNLLPIWPLDGGRIFRALLPGRELFHILAETATAVVLLGLGIRFWLWENMGIMPFFLALFVTARSFCRKIPCIAAQLGVQ